MAQVTAKLTNYRQSPRKVRLVADLVRGKKVSVALSELQFLAKRSGMPMKKLIESALANAEQQSINKDNLIIKELRVDQGVTIHRFMPRARGRAFPIRKRSSHVVLVLDEASEKQNRSTRENTKKEKTEATTKNNNKKK